MTPAAPVIACDNLVRIFRAEGIEVVALQGLDLTVGPGELLAIVGASGSGKSTLLNILSGLDRPSAGAARVAGHDLMAMSDRERLHYRRHSVGFLFQQAAQNLLPRLTVAENVQLPMLLSGVRGRERASRAGELLDALGIAETGPRRPQALSGGQQQRAALAVALANRPEVLLADEPTGELDARNSAEVLEAIRHVNESLGTTVVIVTHDPSVSDHVRRTIGIRDGRTSTEVLRRHVGSEGGAGAAAEEYAVLDKAGRLQLPRAFTEALDLRDRVRLDLEPDHIRVRPGASGPEPVDGNQGEGERA